jgi:hypothetical protein
MPAASRQPNWAVPPRRSGAQISPDGHTFLKRECELFDGPFGCVAGTLFDQSRPAWPSDRLYARAPLEGGLRAEVSLEGLEALVGGAAGAHRFKAEKCGVWLGSAGCVTPLHFDLCHGFLAGILGTKLFTYLAPEDFRSLYPRPEQPEFEDFDLASSWTWTRPRASLHSSPQVRLDPRPRCLHGMRL